MDVSIILDGVDYSLSSGEYAFLRAWEGLGLAPIRRLSSQGPNQRGDTDAGERIEARYISLNLGVVGANEAELDDRRAVVLGLLRSKRRAMVLRFVLANKVERTIPVKYAGGLDTYTRRGKRHGVFAVVFKASDPDFQGEARAITFGQSGGAGAFTVPTPVPTAVGSSVLDETTKIDYEGTGAAYPTIRITGPIDDPVLTNEASGEKLDFTGLEIADGDYIEIDLRYGYKQVTDQDGGRVSPTGDSDVATFGLLPETVNVFRMTGDNVNANTRVDVAWIDTYEFL